MGREDAVEKTDYWVVGVVGVAAVIAIAAMGAFSFPEGLPGTSWSLTGLITSEPAEVETPAFHLLTVNPYDYNNDGVVDEEDSRLLSRMILEGKCSYGHDCDLNNDGVLDLTDLGLFNAQILASRAPPITAKATASPRTTAPQTTPKTCCLC